MENDEYEEYPEFEPMGDEEFEALTDNRKEVEIINVKARISIITGELNRNIKWLAKRGYDKKLEVYEQDDTKRVVKVHSGTNVQGIPKIILIL